MTANRFISPLDHLIVGVDKALRVVGGVTAMSRPNPGTHAIDSDLTDTERRHSAGLMRVNHVGEVCAQALYDAQASFAHTPQLRAQFEEAGQEEEDHLAWCAQRLTELGSQPSMLNPLWYAGAYVMGAVAAKIGDPISLGFVVETERQVEAHLNSHLELLPQNDARSRAIVDQMRIDEIAHAEAAQAMGAAVLPMPVKAVMQAMAKVMTTTAYRI
jgi:ubiquinone biosynthesis monooxygenase Coq7